MPSVARQALSAASAAWRMAGAALSGAAVLVTPEIKAERMAVCLVCDQVSKTSHAGTHRCAVCGCWLDGNVLCKACLETETCPLEKWRR